MAWQYCDNIYDELEVYQKFYNDAINLFTDIVQVLSITNTHHNLINIITTFLRENNDDDE